MDKSAVSAINSWVVGCSGFGARDAQVFRALEEILTGIKTGTR